MNEVNNFFKSAFSVDGVIFGFDEGDLKVLLIKRGEEPYKGKWALPGDLVYPNEDLSTAAGRVLLELTGLKNVFLEQVRAFGEVDRHPLGRVITIAYFSLIKISDYEVTPASFAKKAQWHSVSEVGDLAFDHNEILSACFGRLQEIVRTRPVGFELLPPKFTLTELQHLYESILETDLDKRNFRKKILSMKLLVDLDETQEGVAHRPAKLYEFDQKRYRAFISEGFSFELKESKRKALSKMKEGAIL
ncbi:NUDIX domain-containing protein [Saprospiraceae bacterium]|jgi:8-oxo-dGTP diphosphatase|nr:NUDIX domain-containing protein [Bacteroidota bacterium]MDB4727275.1 NUDIX domain-containing protein [Saprospiraceae bacterium]MDF1864788.1 NUDIX domain-containing protein [Saprospiraceae bacterium]